MSFLNWPLVILVLSMTALNSGVSADEIDYEALYASGQSYEDFLDEAVKRRKMWLRNTEKASLPEDVVNRLNAITGTWRLLVVAVDACSDSANIVPYLAAMSASSPKLELRIVDPTAGRPVMEENRTPDGRPATPTIAVLNHQYEPIGFLIERPATLRDWALANKDELSSSEFLAKKFAWYDEDRGVESMSEILDAIESVSGKGTDLD